ncbi:hypothetical protein LAZ67_1004019 [Cordylochernes scorpioides]|uniref:PID domain-containing protein n=1 Tax=Cordylochernes scorpioides TaxID=51811 RepID=A0ABY6JXA1_9ARAC|nr:hypothetical protein LAZ67_1004019 [Cordylochernes scorpioides]
MAADGGVRTRYLGCATFRSSRPAAPGVSVLQRPLLEVYSAARRRGEDHRAPLALTQRLHVAPGYGVVVGEGPLVTKVITPLSNLTLWAAVRFQARVLRRRGAFGAAFVPLACSDAGLEPVPLSNKQRFLVSLTHPSIFACVLRRVASPKSFECHAFVCASAEEALTLCARLQEAQDADRAVYPPAPLSLPPSTHLYSEEESPSDVTLSRELLSRRETPAVHYSKLKHKDEQFSSSGPTPPPRKLRHRSAAKSSSRLLQLSEGRYSTTPSPSPKELPTQPHFRSNDAEPRRSEKLRRRAVPNRHRKSFSRQPRRSLRLKHQKTQVASSSDAENISPRKIEERWEPATYWKSYKNAEYHSSVTSLENEDYKRQVRKVQAVDSHQRASCDTSEEMDSSTSIPNSARQLQRIRASKQNKPKVRDHMVITESIELSSESEFSFLNKSDRQTNDRIHTPSSSGPPKAYYFGYEAYNSPNDFGASKRNPKVPIPQVKVIKTSLEVHHPPSILSTTESKSYLDYIKSADKVIINIPYSFDKNRHVPHGVRCFSRTSQVRNWSTLSSECSGPQSCVTLPAISSSTKPSKIIRWSSDERFVKARRRTNFLATLKRVSLKSLYKARFHTERFLANMRSRLTDRKKSSECSEDSAYVSEVCRSPRGAPRLDDSDSGLDEYHTDYRSESELEQLASQVRFMGRGLPPRSWSQTNLKDELGYIP